MPELITPLRQPPSRTGGADSGGTNYRRDQGPSAAEGTGSLSFDPEANFSSWAIKRSDVLPEGVEPPADPLKPDSLPRDMSNEIPRYDDQEGTAARCS